MLKPWTALLSFFILAGCSAGQNLSGTVASKQGASVVTPQAGDVMVEPKPNAAAPSNQPSTLEADQKILPAVTLPASSPAPMPDDEPVNKPQIISGTFLYCEEITDLKNSNVSKKVGCAFKRDSDNQNIDIEADFKSHKWSFLTASPLTATLVEYPATSRYHAEFLIKADDPELFNGTAQLMTFKLDLVDRANQSAVFSVGLSTRFAKWIPINGGPLPRSAVLGGTEQKASINLGVCRIHYLGSIVPGKLSWNSTADNSKTVCYANLEGKSLRSNEDVTGKLVYPSDILITEGRAFNDLLEWVPLNNGQVPILAFQGGLDANGKPIYLCQALETSSGIVLVSGQKANDPKGENTPGYVNEAKRSCAYDFYGIKYKSDYKVLTWKAAAFKN